MCYNNLYVGFFAIIVISIIIIFNIGEIMVRADFRHEGIQPQAPIPLQGAKHKLVKEIGPEALAKNEKVSRYAQLQFNKITHFRVEKEAPVWERILHKLNIFVFAGDVINKLSILRGALKSWDPTRLLSGKHVSFDRLGAEHIQLKSKYNQSTDATYLSASSLANKLEQFGGQRVQFKPHFVAEDPYEREEVNVELKDGTKFKALHVSPSALQQHNYDIRPIEQYYSSKKMVIIQDKEGGLYAVLDSTYNNLYKEKKLQDNEFVQDYSSKPVNSNELELVYKDMEMTNDFSGYYFDKKSPELMKILENLDIGKSPWILKEYGDKAFLVKRSDLPKVELCHRQDPTFSNLEMKKAKPLEDTREKGTVILSMNQSEIYEQYGSEFLTFALEGINVIGYNNGGKGLSKGLSDMDSLNKSIEGVYHYLRDVKEVPDDKILAKGQCFGGAPTAWLGRQHPRINVMMDQSPANFYEPAAKVMKDKIAPNERDSSSIAKFRRAAIRFLGINYIIDGISEAIIAGYDSAENLKHNRGHKLIHHNIPNEFGSGGDALVSDKHIDMLVEAASDATYKVKQLSYNPGGIHVCNWFGNPLSCDTVMNFLHEANLSSKMFEFE